MSLGKISTRIPNIFKNKLFVSILLIKIISSFLFGSDFIVHGFVPFVQYFVESGFSDPCQYFTEIGQIKAFPYPTVMLAILAVPYAIVSFVLSGNVINDAFMSMFIIRLPILAADLFIFYVLAKWLRTKEDQVLKYYWASPILFYISYFHGQLDAIPIAILFLSIAFMFRNKIPLSGILFGAGMAAKTNILLVLPFMAIFLWKNRSLKDALTFTFVAAIAYGSLIAPFVFSDGFAKMVFGASEQFRVFDLAIPLGFQNILLLAVPAAYLILLFNFSSYEKMNKDVLMMMIALVFTVVVTLVPPAQGWYFWVVPFLIYFFVKQEKVPMVSFWAINIFYLTYFLFNQSSDIFQSFQLILPNVASLPTPYQMAANIGIDPSIISNILFTGLTASLVMTAIWTYYSGVRSNLEYRKKVKPTFIGIGGDSGAGKSTSAELLSDIFGNKNTVIVNGDDMHKWERGNENWKVFTHLNPDANKLHKELEQAIALSEWNKLSRVTYDHKTGKFTEPVEVEPNQFVIFEGLHPFYLKRMRDLYDMKLYIHPAEELKLHWKILRDMKDRGYTKEQVIKNIEKRKIDREKFIDPQKQFADIVVSRSLKDGIKDMGSPNAKFETMLKIWLDNSIDMEPFENALSSVKTLNVITYNENDLKTQCCEFYGAIAEAELESCLQKLVPNFEELIYNPSPKFRNGYDGVYQLFVIYYLSEISKFRRV